LSDSRSKWRLIALTGAGLAAGAAVFRWATRPQDPDDLERRRRSHVNRVGRIVDGQIVGIIELAATPSEEKANSARKASRRDASDGQRNLVGYSYSISGVSYETAQDVTGLEERAALHSLAAGQPASVKYDPANPSNSILIADDWSGLQ
jgi:hypothetical protein